MDRTYVSWMEGKWHSKQKEYTEPTKLLAEDGTLLAPGYAKHNVFDYDRNSVKHPFRRKEWDFYQISDGNLMVQLSFANISLGGYVSAVVVDIHNGGTPINTMNLFLGGGNKYALPAKGDQPNKLSYKIGGAEFEFNTTEEGRTLYYKYKDVEAKFQMDHLPNHENLTTVLPFDGFKDRYFMTTKQVCMPCEGYIKSKDHNFEFTKEDCFCSLDWGRVCTPYSLVWYWGSGSTYLTDEAGNKHPFGFEITWGIGNEENATETAIFYDGKCHKFGAVDVETFPKPDKYMEPWKFVSEDGRFDLTMTPFYDHHSDLNVLVMRMHSHQVHGIWNGTVTLDDGTKLEIKDMYAFCEYVENRW